LIASLIVYAFFQVLWVTVTPLKMQSVGNSLRYGDVRPILVGTGPDEPQHYLYVLSVAESGHIPRPLPRMRRSASEFVSAEAQHPPLFYVIAAGLRNMVLPMGDKFVWYTLRGFGTLCGALAIWLISRMALIAFPDRPFIGIAMPPFLAFLPMYDYMTSELSNFPLELLFTSSGLLLLVMLARGRTQLNFASCSLLGLLFGLAAITRQTSSMWIPAVVIVLVFVIRAAERDMRRHAIVGALAFLAIYAMFALPWFAYMKLSYGALFFRSDYRPLLGVLSLRQYLADPTQWTIDPKSIPVPNMHNGVHCSVMMTVLWYASTFWTPVWITQYTDPRFFGSLAVFQSPGLVQS
jgi:hypothetical protein